jgi:ATP-dependent Clp protease, protease subunit
MAFGQPLRVPYNLPGSRSWQWVNIYTRMAQERIVFLNQPLTMNLANSVVSYLLYLDSQDDKPISLYINSIGDPVDAGMANITAGMMSVGAGLAIYDTLATLKSEVNTIAMGQVAGMAALLLAAGTPGKRASLPHTSFILSQPQFGSQGQASDIQVSAEQMKSKKQMLLELFSKHTGQDIARLGKDLDRTFYMTAEQAKEYGLIDRVVTTMKAADLAAAA